jgi:hypothetical protein
MKSAQDPADRLRSTLIELTANLLRVVGLAGKANILPEQCIAYIEANTTYREATGQKPNPHMILSVDPEKFPGRLGERSDEDRALDMMLNAALQIIASRLMNQKAIEHNGRAEFDEGLENLMVARAEAAQEAVFREELIIEVLKEHPYLTRQQATAQVDADSMARHRCEAERQAEDDAVTAFVRNLEHPVTLEVIRDATQHHSLQRIGRLMQNLVAEGLIEPVPRPYGNITRVVPKRRKR